MNYQERPSHFKHVNQGIAGLSASQDVTIRRHGMSSQAALDGVYDDSVESQEVENTVLESFHRNLSQLEDLHARLNFMMGEIQGLVRK